MRTSRNVSDDLYQVKAEWLRQALRVLVTQLVRRKRRSYAGIMGSLGNRVLLGIEILQNAHHFRSAKF